MVRIFYSCFVCFPLEGWTRYRWTTLGNVSVSTRFSQHDVGRRQKPFTELWVGVFTVDIVDCLLHTHFLYVPANRVRCPRQCVLIELSQPQCTLSLGHVIQFHPIRCKEKSAEMILGNIFFYDSG